MPKVERNACFVGPVLFKSHDFFYFFLHLFSSSLLGADQQNEFIKPGNVQNRAPLKNELHQVL